MRTPQGALRHIDIWESDEACARAFDERIHAAVDTAFGGQRPAGEPAVRHFEVIHLTGSILDHEVWADPAAL